MQCGTWFDVVGAVSGALRFVGGFTVDRVQASNHMFYCCRRTATISELYHMQFHPETAHRINCFQRDAKWYSRCFGEIAHVHLCLQ